MTKTLRVAALALALASALPAPAVLADERLNAAEREGIRQMREALKVEEQEAREAALRKKGRSVDGDLDAFDLDDDDNLEEDFD